MRRVLSCATNTTLSTLGANVARGVHGLHTLAAVSRRAAVPRHPGQVRRVGGIPGNMGTDHVGIIVPNVQQAKEFLMEVFDAEFDWEVKRDPTPTAGERGWSKLFGVHPDSYMPHVVMLKCGDAHLAQYIELFEWVSPDQYKPDGRGEAGWFKFSDVGNSYLSFTVKDLAAVMRHVKQHVIPKWKNVRFIQDPPMTFPLRGEECTSTFLISPWGMWIELTQWSQSGPEGQVIKAIRQRTTKHPAIGRPIQELETPAFMLDLDVFEHNVKLMTERFTAKRVDWRPPCKGHKCPELAKRMLERGAQGIVVLTVQEAESFAAAGIKDIFIANEIIGASALRRVTSLAKTVQRLRINVDHRDNLRALSDAVMGWEIKTPVEVLIEINIGHNRCGVTPQEAVELAKYATELQTNKRGIVFVGISGYEGHTPILAPADKTRETQKSHAVLAEARQLIEAAGIRVGVVTGGGSSNYMDALDTGVLTEIQAGGGASTDLLYHGKAGLGAHGHRMGCLVLTTIMSVPQTGNRAMGDAGFKALGWHPFGGLAQPRDRADLEVIGLSAEHTKFQFKNYDGVNAPVKRGDKIVLIPGYQDAMGFLHRKLYAIRKDTVEDVWDTTAAKTW